MSCFMSNTVQKTGKIPQPLKAPNLKDLIPEKLT